MDEDHNTGMRGWLKCCVRNWNSCNKTHLKTIPTWTSKNKIGSCEGSRSFFTLSTQKFSFKSWVNNWKTCEVISEKVKTCPDNFSEMFQLQWS